MASKTDKLFIDANGLLEDSFALAARVLESEYIPDLIIGIWRGGSSIAVAVHEFFHFKGFEVDHLPLSINSYTGIGEQSATICIHGFDLIESHLKEPAIDNNSNSTALATGKKLLIVDDVFDSGRSLSALQKQIIRLGSGLSPRLRPEIRIACPWFKPDNNQTSLFPDYYLHETERWLVFPHELMGLSKDEIKQGKSHCVSRLLK